MAASHCDAEWRARPPFSFTWGWHMNDPIKTFGGVASGLSRGPLGVISLFIVLVYGFASLVTAFASAFSGPERLPLIYFLVIFPVLVLGVFSWLVSQHSGKLYPPDAFKNEEIFLEVQKMQEMRLRAATSLAMAELQSSEGSNTLVDVSHAIEATNHISRGVSPLKAGRILWVDDRPKNNQYTKEAFESVGISVDIALSTREALEKLNTQTYNAIISDMGRVEGPREGYILLDKIRELGLETPFFVHAGSSSTQHKIETQRHGGQGCTSNPSELFEMVMRAIV